MGVVVVNVLRRIGQHRPLRNESGSRIGVCLAVDDHSDLRSGRVSKIVRAAALVHVGRLEEVRREHRRCGAADAGHVRVEPDDARVGRILAAEIEIRLAVVVNKGAGIEEPLRWAGRARSGAGNQRAAAGVSKRSRGAGARRHTDAAAAVAEIKVELAVIGNH